MQKPPAHSPVGDEADVPPCDLQLRPKAECERARGPSAINDDLLLYDRRMDLMSLADRSWPILRRLGGLHTQVYRLSNGIVGHRFPGSPPMLLLIHVGGKSGLARTTPLVYVDDDPNIVLVASKGGHPQNPAWFHNLRANPDTTIQVGAERRAVHARVAIPEERRRLWPKAVATYSGYEGYQARTKREIPLVILEPA